MTLSGIAAKLYEAYNRQDADAAGRLYAADATHEDIAQGRPKNGATVIAEGLGKFFGWFPDAHWEPECQIGAGDGDGPVSVPYLLSATLQSAMGPIAAQGQKITLRGIHVLHLKDGLIQRSEDYWDAGTFQRQLNNN